MVAAKSVGPVMLATLLAAGCLHTDHEVPEAPAAPEHASVAGRFGEQGATVVVRGWSCDGIYGRWHVRVRVEGVATGEGEGDVVLRRGRATRFRDEFDVRISAVRATAAVDLSIRVDGDVLDVRGEAAAEALFVRVRAPVRERLPIRRSAVPECSSQ